LERIKEAIARAKAAQEGAKPAEPAASPEKTATDLPAVKTEGSKEVADPNAISKPIEYRQTRVIELDPVHLESNRIISYMKTDSRTLSFDRLRTQVLRKMKDNGWRTLAVTSPTAGCGKTTTALNLTMSIAHQTEQTVLLADLDLRSPKVAEYLGLPDAASLIDYLNGDAQLQEVFVNPNIPRLTILPNHKAIVNAAEMIMTSRMKELVTDIRDRYESRMVIFDLPALLTTDDALAFLPQVDCVLIVVENGATTKSEIRDAIRLLQSTPILGTVLNKGEVVAQSSG